VFPKSVPVCSIALLQCHWRQLSGELNDEKNGIERKRIQIAGLPHMEDLSPLLALKSYATIGSRETCS